MTTALAERRSLGKISRKRLIKQSRAIGNVARRDGLPEYMDHSEVQAMIRYAPHA